MDANDSMLKNLSDHLEIQYFVSKPNHIMVKCLFYLINKFDFINI